MKANFERNVPACLIVRVAGIDGEPGEEFEPTEGDLARFGLLPAERYRDSWLRLEELLGLDGADETEVTQAVQLALEIVNAWTVYDWAREHPEYRDDAIRLAGLLGVEVDGGEVRQAEVPN